jgi:dTMP kinase
VGYFITFEGIEGCGKTTQLRLLAGRLASDGYRIVTTREPGGCAISDQIRSILLDADNRAMQPLTELLLYAAARAQHVAEVIRPALESGNVVLCDRFSDATIAYQSFGRGIGRTTIDLLSTLACQALSPDLTILIDCEASVGLGRARQRIEATAGPREERFELESLEFHQQVRHGYLELAKREPGRFVVIDGNATPDEIAVVIASRVMPRIGEAPHAVR